MGSTTAWSRINTPHTRHAINSRRFTASFSVSTTFVCRTAAIPVTRTDLRDSAAPPAISLNGVKLRSCNCSSSIRGHVKAGPPFGAAARAPTATLNLKSSLVVQVVLHPPTQSTRWSRYINWVMSDYLVLGLETFVQPFGLTHTLVPRLRSCPVSVDSLLLTAVPKKRN